MAQIAQDAAPLLFSMEVSLFNTPFYTPSAAADPPSIARLFVILVEILAQVAIKADAGVLSRPS